MKPIESEQEIAFIPTFTFQSCLFDNICVCAVSTSESIME